MNGEELRRYADAKIIEGAGDGDDDAICQTCWATACCVGRTVNMQGEDDEWNSNMKKRQRNNMPKVDRSKWKKEAIGKYVQDNNDDKHTLNL